MLLYEILVGHLPNPEDCAAIADERSDCTDLDGVIKRAIASERRRISTAEEFREQLRSVANAS